jgi:lipopolysaccharide export system protein LptA
MLRIIQVLVILLLNSFAVMAQNPGSHQDVPGSGRIQIVHADDLQASRINGEDVQRLKGNVVFRQNDVTMTCDSAILYGARNVLQAYGNVHINQHDSLNLYGDQLDYNGTTKYCVIQRHVRMTDRQMTLTTEQFDYDFIKKEGFYTTGGNITDAENKLKSKIGYYFSETRDMYFKQNVVLTNPDFVMTCDTLQYNIISKKAIFHGPTTIVNEKDKELIYSETGWYNTETNKAQFGKNAYLKSQNQLLYGDSLYYDRKLGFGKAVNNIRIIDTAEKLLIQGQYAENYQKTKTTFITNQVLVTRGFKTDSMFISSDTLRTLFDSSGKHRIIKAYYHAKIYDRQFQAVTDSLIYSSLDSTIDLRTKPVFWFDLYQATAKRILVHTKDNKISKADLMQDAFMISAEDSVRFSQIKGRDMYAYFKNNEMNRIDVNGNSESIYYVRDDKKAFIGMNKIISSNIKIEVKDKKISRINFIKDPDATLVPMKDANPLEARLPGFLWRIKERPKSLEDIKRAPDPVKTEPVKTTSEKKEKKRKERKKPAKRTK